MKLSIKILSKEMNLLAQEEERIMKACNFEPVEDNAMAINSIKECYKEFSEFLEILEEK